MISRRFRCIYLHIPKTAGNSINRVFSLDWQHHKDLQYYSNELGAERLREYYKFAVVRNPWDRILSDYNYQMKKSRPVDSKLHVFDEAGERRSFRAWVEAALRDPHRYDPESWGGEVSPGIHRWSPQVDWLTVDGAIAVDAIIRFERLQEGFDSVCRTLGLVPIPLPRRNWKFHWHYSRYYDDATRELVADYYSKDLHAFDYVFEDNPIERVWSPPKPSLECVCGGTGGHEQPLLRRNVIIPAPRSIMRNFPKRSQMGFLALALLAAIAWADYVTGYEVTLFLLYFIPIFLATRYAGLPTGLMFCVLAALSSRWVDFASGHHFSHTWIYWERGMTTLTNFVLICFFFHGFSRTLNWAKSKAKHAAQDRAGSFRTVAR